MLKGADFVTSNVPGAPFPIYSRWRRAREHVRVRPLSGAAINITLLSHCGTCCIGVNLDAVAVPDREVLVHCLEEAFAEVLALGADTGPTKVEFPDRKEDRRPVGAGESYPDGVTTLGVPVDAEAPVDAERGGRRSAGGSSSG